VNLHPADVDDAIGRATRAANRARVLPRWWVALAVQCSGRWYVVVLGRPPAYPVAAVYRIRPDLRLKRIVRWPWPLPNLARNMLGTTPLQQVEQPGQREGWTMTSARFGTTGTLRNAPVRAPGAEQVQTRSG
jgi:hypothetical protein